MKKKRVVLQHVLTVFFLCVTMRQAFAAGSPLETIVVGVPDNRCPIFYRDAETGAVTGIGADLMRIAAEKAGYTAQLWFIEEPSLKEALDSTAYDVVLPFGSAITSAKGSPVVVTDNLFQTPFTMVTVSSQHPVSLEALHVGMLRSLAGAGETVLQLYPGVTITFFESMEAGVKALRDGRVDALLHNSYVWSYTLQKPAYEDLQIQPLAMFSMDFRAGVVDSPKSRALVDRLNAGIAQIADTQRQAIILDYTSRKLYRYGFDDYLYQYGVFMLLGLLLVAAVIALVVLRVRTMRLEHEKKLRELINYDPLTGVLSMTGFRSKVEELLRAHPDTIYTISYNNLRNFKYINESLGMDAGDELLCFWADKGKSIMTDLDALARIDADHFAFLRHFEGLEQIADDVKSVADPVRDFFIRRNQEIRVQLCSGIYVLTPADYQNIQVDQMLDFARVAEKRLRDNHKSGYEFYNEEQWKTGRLIADLINHLPVALESEEIQVWYQPQVDYVTGKIIGAEALCRWNVAQRGWISPTEFIPALEEAGLIFELDCYIWEKVCEDLQRWNEEGKRRTISVNVSRADLLKDVDIAGHFLDLIQTYKLTPDQLHIEITESAYVENSAMLISTTDRLRKYGFTVEMDDFGSGYSSLNMLKEVQVDRIKLDLHFLTETGDPRKGRIIIKHIIKMAQSLGMSLIAEGVEYKEQAVFLKETGCTEMQGFYFHKAMPVADFERLLDHA